jgi:4-amino-4-deoxy-L-arabinose transferase-like glycosyltransferase
MIGALVLMLAVLVLPPVLALVVHLDRRARRPVRQPVGWWSPPPPRRHARARR